MRVKYMNRFVSKVRIPHLGSRIVSACILFFLNLFASAFAADWVKLSNCRLAENLSNDGDSFVVELPEPYMGQEQLRFRLYFVDTAETDANSDFKRDRLKEQAAYWESNNPDFALKMGLRAEQNVKRLFRGGFTVFTKGEYAPTMGAPRIYALIRVKDRWLDEWLVEEGLARIYGNGTALPDGTDADDHWRELRLLERKARAAGKNGWVYASPQEGDESPQEEFRPYDTVTVRTTWIYSAKNGRKVMVIPVGTPVSVVAEEDGTRLRIRFKKAGQVYEGLCEKSNLK